MEEICLKGPDTYAVTPLSNYFIDEIMPDANGEFVKVYLYLLRVLSSNSNISICHIADKLNHTEKDVIRALKYWEQAGLLLLQKDSKNHLTGIQLLDIPHTEKSNSEDSFIAESLINQSLINESLTDEPSLSKGSVKESDTEDVSKADTSSSNVISASQNDTSPSRIQATESRTEKKSYSASEISRFKENPDIVQLLYVAERYTGRNLSKSDINVILYIYDELHMPVELIEYLLEYCISNNHTSCRYIEKTAINWAQEGIDTIEKAKANAIMYSRVCYPVLNAFGITGRAPVKHERDLIIKWTNSYGFSMDIILEACERTMKTATPPSFNYADGILTKWYQHGIRTKTDIEPLDKEHELNKAQHKAKTAGSKQPATKATSNSFNNFQQREYDYEALERQLLNNN